MRFIIRGEIKSYGDTDAQTTHNNDLHNVELVEQSLDRSLATSKDTPGAK